MTSPQPPAKDMDMLDYWRSELRRLRMAAGLSLRAFGKKIGYSTSTVGHVETGERHPSPDFANKCAKALNSDHLDRIWGMVNRGGHPTWFRPWLDMEREAHTLRNFQTVLIPGLLQTADYARATLQASGHRQAPEEVEEAVSRRIRRQEIMCRPDPPSLMMFLDEAVLLRPIGGPEVMRTQLNHLIDLPSRYPHVSIQVVPFSAGAHPGIDGPMIIASFHHSPDIVYLETPGRGEIIADNVDVLFHSRRFDAVRVLALSQPASLDLIRKAMERWT